MKSSDWPSPTVAMRHESKTDRSGGPEACWPWLGTHNDRGYGTISAGTSSRQVTLKAHRVAWVIEHGEITDDLTIDHLCFTVDCQNVRHMELVPIVENVRRARPIRSVRHNYRRGEKVHGARLTEEDVRYIRANYKFRQITQKDLAARFGVSETTVQYVLLGLSWSHVT